jgi:hypothetical protein
LPKKWEIIPPGEGNKSWEKGDKNQKKVLGFQGLFLFGSHFKTFSGVRVAKRR